MKLFPKIKYAYLCLLTISIHIINGQTNWTNNKPFEQKYFVQNNGQFTINGKNTKTILFASQIDGLCYYFTKTGYIIKHGNIKRKEEGNEREGEKEESEYGIINEFYEIKFDKANTNAEVLMEDQSPTLFAYGNENKPLETTKAHGYKKIIYKNIYPFIDLVYQFPKDSLGITYSFILNQGANANDINMSFYKNDKAQIEYGENVKVKSSFGEITYYAPLATNFDDKVVNCKLSLKKNIISYSAAATENLRAITQWIVTPTYTVGSNKAYDIDYDYQGNVYIYGANGYGASNLSPILLIYNSSGVLLVNFTSFLCYQYGDMIVDRRNGNYYLAEGNSACSSGARIIKGKGANLLNYFLGNANYREIWRMAYDYCHEKVITAGGGTTGPSYQTGTLNPYLGNFQPVSYIPTTACCYDIGSIAIDDYGYCYQRTIKKYQDASNFYSNKLVKLPLNNLSMPDYVVNTNHSFYEWECLMYHKVDEHGYNGLSTANKNVYSYDSYVLKKWQGSNGNLLAYKRINFPVANDSSKIYWGGLSADNCENVCVGNITKVDYYNASLNLVKSYQMPDTIYDVVLDPNGYLYICGNGFVSKQNITLQSCNVNPVFVTNETCTSKGSATISLNNSSATNTVVWNTVPPQTGTVATNLSAGNYAVTINDNSCKNYITIDTVKVLGPPVKDSLSLLATYCIRGSDVKLSLNATQTPSPPFQWYSYSSPIPNASELSYDGSVQYLNGYSITWYGNDNCKYRSTTIIEDKKTGVDVSTIKKTNIITPNDDDVNEKFFPFVSNTFSKKEIMSAIEDFQLRIYNRWGILIFETDRPGNEWDGRTTSGIAVSDGTYFWTCTVKFKCNNNEATNYNGFLHVER